MALPDSTTVTPAFLQDSPDYSKTITVSAAFRTTAVGSRGGGDQRARRRRRPRYSIAYSLADLNLAEFTVRRSAGLTEMQSPVVVPIWTDYKALSSMTSANVAELGISLAKRKFKVGSYAYFVQAGKVSTFRKITAIGSTTITFAGSGHFPAGSLPSFTAGARVYPCILGMRTDNGVEFSLSKVDRSQEEIRIEEL